MHHHDLPVLYGTVNINLTREMTSESDIRDNIHKTAKFYKQYVNSYRYVRSSTDFFPFK